MDKKLREKILEYTVIFEPASEGGYVVSAPSLPGCMTQGETFEEATINIKDAIQGYLEVLNEQEDAIPQETSDLVITKVSIANPFSSSI